MYVTWKWQLSSIDESPNTSRQPQTASAARTKDHHGNLHLLCNFYGERDDGIGNDAADGWPSIGVSPTSED